ncbi:MAG: septal ring lytic transglycosylase RlpA family protein [Pseudorhodoferax sp.]
MQAPWNPCPSSALPASAAVAPRCCSPAPRPPPRAAGRVRGPGGRDRACTGGAPDLLPRRLAGRPTASGERFDPEKMTMAHETLPFGTLVRVTNMLNRRSVVVRVNDRGAWSADRIGDVSTAAARELGMLRRGVVRAQLELVDARGPVR